MKPIKITLDIFGESLKLEFQNNFPAGSDYVSEISKTKAIKCYHAVVNRLAKDDLPKDVVVSAKMSTCTFNNYHLHLSRYWKMNGETQTFDIYINTGYDNAYIRISNNMIDWLQQEQIVREQLRLMDNRKKKQLPTMAWIDDAENGNHLEVPETLYQEAMSIMSFKGE
jgi:hypothetical protein